MYNILKLNTVEIHTRVYIYIFRFLHRFSANLKLMADVLSFLSCK